MEYAANLVESLWPLGLYLGLVVLLITSMLVIPFFTGSRRNERATGEPYESGIVPSEISFQDRQQKATSKSAIEFSHFRVPIPFYLIAIFFVIFDLEAVFLFAWAIALRETGWLGFIEAFIFIFILVIALVYLWRLGALDWRTRRQREDVKALKR